MLSLQHTFILMKFPGHTFFFGKKRKKNTIIVPEEPLIWVWPIKYLLLFMRFFALVITCPRHETALRPGMLVGKSLLIKPSNETNPPGSSFICPLKDIILYNSEKTDR